MARRIDGMLGDNQEYTKAKGMRPDDESPRENPDHQGPADAAVGRPEYARWGTDELREHLRTLEVAGVEDMSRDELIDVLQRRDSTRARG